MSKSPYIQTTREPFDAIVVGSGVTGGWAAKELTEKGLKTLMVERGKAVEHRKDYSGEGVKAWEMPQRGRVDKQLVDEQHSIQQQCYAFNDATKHFFGNDRDYPYQQDKPFSWIRGNALGGKSLLWHRQSYRWSDLDFQANQKDGHGVDWPIRYKDVAPGTAMSKSMRASVAPTRILTFCPIANFYRRLSSTKSKKTLKSALKSATKIAS